MFIVYYLEIICFTSQIKIKVSASEMCTDTDILNTFGNELFTKLLPKLRLSNTPI